MAVLKVPRFADTCTLSQETAANVLDANTPAECQKLGRQAKGYDGKKWDERKMTDF